jgi:2-C-methyl-D-erythritol 4-phosphate cytidylyltransferase
LCNAADRDKIQKILLTLKDEFSKVSFVFTILESSFSRMSSIDKALKHKSVNPCAPVFIHDAARPFIQPQSILKMASSLLNVNSQYVNSQRWDKSKCAVMAEKPTNSLLFKKDDLNNNFDFPDKICPINSNKIYPLNRERVISIATPFAGIAQRIIENRKKFFDYLEIPGYEDTAVSGLAGMNISFIYQNTPNLKITYPGDFIIMKSLAQELSLSPNCLES